MMDRQKAVSLAAQLRAVPTLYDTIGDPSIRTDKMVSAGSVLMQVFDAAGFDNPKEAWLCAALRIQASYRDDKTCKTSWQIGAFREAVKHFVPELHARLTNSKDHDVVDEACRLLADVIEAGGGVPDGGDAHALDVKKCKRKGGRKPDPAVAKRNDNWLAEYEKGEKNGTFETTADFARHVGEEYDTVRKALGQAKNRRESS